MMKIILASCRYFLFLILFSNVFIFNSNCIAQEKPNVIVIVADDLGWNDVGYHGSDIQTPNIDRLAREGVELNRFYVHPTCSPSRSALVTGKSPLRLGFLSPVSKNNRLGLHLSEKTIADYFKQNGYQTSLIGKWHLGRFSKDYLPTNRGFDHFYGFLTGGVGHYDHVHGGGLDWQRNGKTIREDGYTTHLLTDEAIRIIENYSNKLPFFLELSYAAPHMPNEAPKKSVDQYKHLKNVNRQLHAAMVTEIDKGVQRIYNALQKEAILDNTIIWFTSDNGGECAEAYPKSFKKRINQLTEIFGTPLPVKSLEFVRNNIYNSASDNKPLRGGKGSAYEGGVRVPAFIYAPNFLQQRKVNQRITINDVLPSLSIASGFVDFDMSNLDGVDQWTFLSGKGNYSSTDYIVHGTYGKEAYYQDNWKLIVSENSNLELYNLFDDPFEMNNVANKNKLLVANILSKLKAFPRGKSVHDPIWKTVLDMDEFGGKENRPPWAEIEGVNAGPLHPIYFILPTLLLGVVGLIWYIRLKIRTKRKIN